MCVATSLRACQLHFPQQQQQQHTRTAPSTPAAAVPAPSHPRLRCPSSSNRRRATSRLHIATKAQLGDMLDTVVTWGAVAAGAGGVVYSLFYDWKHQDQQQDHQQQQQQQDAAMFGPPDNITWAVMGVVSCVPFFNYLAFAQGALTSNSPRLWYWAAGLYALPLLHSGFQLDWFNLTMVALGAAQIQVLRIGATEPQLQAKLQQQLKPLAVVQTLTNTAGAAAGAAFGSSSSSSWGRAGQRLGAGSSRAVGDVLQGDRSGGAAGGEGEGEGEFETEEVLRQQQELDEFDRRLQQQMSRDDKSD